MCSVSRRAVSPYMYLSEMTALSVVAASAAAFRVSGSGPVQFKMTTGNEPETQTQGLDSHQLGYGGNNEKEIYT